MSWRSDHDHSSILRYPTVEYIPLYPQTVARGQLNAPSRQVAGVVICGDSKCWNIIRERYHLNPEISPDTTGHLLVLTVHFIAEDIMYRGHSVIMIGSSRKSWYHLFHIVTRYFYKQHLHFELYEHNGARLAWENFDLSTTTA